MRRWLLFDAFVALAVAGLALARWGYPWQLAVLIGGAAGALAYTTRRTYFNIRDLQSTEPFSVRSSSPSSSTSSSASSTEAED